MIQPIEDILNQKQNSRNLLLDPSLLRAARQIYLVFSQVHGHNHKQPIGVVINPKNYRGQVVCGKKPILLPHENFIPINQINTQN